MMIKLIGYWSDRVNPKNQFQIDPKVEKYLDKKLWEPYTENDQYPWPGDLVDPGFWQGKDKEKVIKYLASGIPCNHYSGFSGCRLCNQILGTCERTDGFWAWPDKFEHYIDNHDIRIPEEFLTHIAGRDYEIMSVEDLSQIIKPYAVQDGKSFFQFEPDESFWVKWGRNKQMVGF